MEMAREVGNVPLPVLEANVVSCETPTQIFQVQLVPKRKNTPDEGVVQADDMRHRLSAKGIFVL